MKIVRTKLFKQLSALLMLFVAFCLVVTPMVSNAYSDNDISYTFQVAANGGPSHFTAKEYRNTKDTNNAWKVGMSTSTESRSVRSVTKFYLGVQHSPYNAVGSEMYKVIVREGPKYYPSYTNALHTYVYLYARDDTITNKSYTVTGVWDEETGKAPSADPWV